MVFREPSTVVGDGGYGVHFWALCGLHSLVLMVFSSGVGRIFIHSWVPVVRVVFCVHFWVLVVLFVDRGRGNFSEMCIIYGGLLDVGWVRPVEDGEWVAVVRQSAVECAYGRGVRDM